MPLPLLESYLSTSTFKPATVISARPHLNSISFLSHPSDMRPTDKGTHHEERDGNVHIVPKFYSWSRVFTDNLGPSINYVTLAEEGGGLYLV